MICINPSFDKNELYNQIKYLMKYYFIKYFKYSDLYASNLLDETTLKLSNCHSYIHNFINAMNLKEINECIHLAAIFISCDNVENSNKMYQQIMTKESFMIADILPNPKIITFLDLINYLTNEYKLIVNTDKNDTKIYINYLFTLLKSMFDCFDIVLKQQLNTYKIIDNLFVDKYLV